MSKKLKKGGLDQYDPERFGRLVFATIRKKCGNERVKAQLLKLLHFAIQA